MGPLAAFADDGADVSGEAVAMDPGERGEAGAAAVLLPARLSELFRRPLGLGRGDDGCVLAGIRLWRLLPGAGSGLGPRGPGKPWLDRGRAAGPDLGPASTRAGGSSRCDEHSALFIVQVAWARW